MNTAYSETTTATPFYCASTLSLEEEDKKERQSLSAKQSLMLVLVPLLSTAFIGPQPSSVIYQSDTAKSYIDASAENQRLDTQRVDLRIIARVRELGTYRDGWDGLDGKAPSHVACSDAEEFARLLPYEKIHAPHVSLAADGEVNFLWILPNFRLDLGFYGDGTYSYYGKTSEGKEFIADEETVDKSLPKEIIDLIAKNSW